MFHFLQQRKSKLQNIPENKYFQEGQLSNGNIFNSEMVQMYLYPPKPVWLTGKATQFSHTLKI